MSYNLTFTNTTNTLADLAVGINTASGGVLAVSILLVAFVIVFAQTVKNGTSSAIISASLVTTLLGLFFWWAEMIGWSVVMAPFVLLMVSVVARFFQGNPGG